MEDEELVEALGDRFGEEAADEAEEQLTELTPPRDRFVLLLVWTLNGWLTR